MLTKKTQLESEGTTKAVKMRSI